MCPFVEQVVHSVRWRGGRVEPPTKFSKSWARQDLKFLIFRGGIAGKEGVTF